MFGTDIVLVRVLQIDLLRLVIHSERLFSENKRVSSHACSRIFGISKKSESFVCFNTFSASMPCQIALLD